MDPGSPHGHTAGMTRVEKIAISLPAPLAARARLAVRQGRAPSVSAYVAGALEQRVKLDELESLLSELLDESGGPLTAAEARRLDRELGVRAKARPKRAG